MPQYHLTFRLSPTGNFGLPDGDVVVIPHEPAGRQISLPGTDKRTGHVIKYGTLSEYRTQDAALQLEANSQALKFRMTDNFLEIVTEAPTAKNAANTITECVDLLCRVLSAQAGRRFSAELFQIKDANGVPQTVGSSPVAPVEVSYIFYDIPHLKKLVERAIEWAATADPIAKKSLLYFEHACLLQEFSITLPSKSPHSQFSWAMAFLQLFKALSMLVGEVGTDKDYQSRSRFLGLQADFWSAKVKPLYTIRNESDVAHTSDFLPQRGAFLPHFNEALVVYIEALSAYMETEAKRRAQRST